jgi:membrane protein
MLKHLLPEKAGTVVANYVLGFSEKAAHLTVAGSLLLVAAAVFLTLTVDHAFNAIWGVTRRRRLLPSIVSHALVLVVGPALLGASLAATTYVVSTSLGWVDEPRWVRTALFRLLPDLILIGVFTLIYFAVPNRPVRLVHAAVGGAVAGVGLLLMQRLFSLYVVKLPTYSLVYGAFAAVPIFLVWLYLSWVVILIGALIAATLPDTRPPPVAQSG